MNNVFRWDANFTCTIQNQIRHEITAAFDSKRFHFCYFEASFFPKARKVMFF